MVMIYTLFYFFAVSFRLYNFRLNVCSFSLQYMAYHYRKRTNNLRHV